MRSFRGCLLLVMLIASSVVCSSGNSSSSPPLGTKVPDEVIIATQQWFIQQQTQAASGAPSLAPMTTHPVLITQNPILATEMQITRVAYSTPSTAAPLPNPTATPQLAPVGALSGTVYAQGSVNLRECPRRDCKFVGALSDGQSVQVTGATNGEAVVAGDPLWFRVLFGGQEAYVYAQYTTDLGPPTPLPPTSAPLIFQGSAAQILGPFTFVPGLYRVRVITGGFFIAQLQITSGDCGTGNYILLPLLLNLMQGQAINGSEAVLRSNGCTTFIEVTNISDSWQLEITQIG